MILRQRVRSAMNRPFALLLIGFVGLALLYARATPPFEAPDEASHFLYIHNIIETGELPILEDRDVMFASQSVQRHHPPLYYLIGAMLTAWTDRSDVDHYLRLNPFASIGVVSENNQNVYLHPITPPTAQTHIAVWILRLYSILLGVGTLCCIYQLGKLISGRESIGILSAAFTAIIPSFVHISASVNNDNLVTFFYSAGVYLLLRIWLTRQLETRQAVLLGIVLGGIALTKINGVSLFGLVYGWLILGALVKRLSWRQVIGTIVVSAMIGALIAGWWYVRNIQLYGDPLAFEATLSIWSRGEPRLISLFEAKGVWDSFWMVLGHFNIRAADWFYNQYLPLLVIVGGIGAVVVFLRKRMDPMAGLILLSVIAANIIMFITATSRINISQGRILFPSLIAIAPLITAGLFTGYDGLRSFVGVRILIVPLLGLAAFTPFLALPRAYPYPVLTDSLPASAQVLNAQAGGLELVGYESHTPVVREGDTLNLTLYLRGNDSRNPYVIVRALHPLTQTVIGAVDLYPAMQPTDSMDATKIYAVPVHVPIRERLDVPFQIQLLFGVYVPDEDFSESGGATALLWQTGEDALRVASGTYLPESVTLPTPQTPIEATFGNQIALHGVTLTRTDDHVEARILLEDLQPMTLNWTMTFGLLSPDGAILAQSDGEPSGYPTSAWIPGMPFEEVRTLDLPPEAAGANEWFIGWYRLNTGERMPASGGDGVRVIDNLVRWTQLDE